MSRLSHNASGVGLRLRAAKAIARMPTHVRSPGHECTGNPLGERLGIAALYAGKADHATARAAALLAVADLPDTPADRAAVLASIEKIEKAIAAALGTHPRTTQ